MKKLLFTCWMSISLLMIAGEPEAWSDYKNIYLVGYIGETIEKMPHFKLTDFSEVDDVKINALSDAEFKLLICGISAAFKYGYFRAEQT